MQVFLHESPQIVGVWSYCVLITGVNEFLNGTKSFLPFGKRATVKKRRTDGTFGTAHRYRGLKALKPCKCDCRLDLMLAMVETTMLYPSQGHQMW